MCCVASIFSEKFVDENFKLKHYSKLQHYGTGWLSMANTGCITETVNPPQATKGDYISHNRIYISLVVVTRTSMAGINIKHQDTLRK